MDNGQMLRVLSLYLVLVYGLFAQSVEFGIKGGLPISEVSSVVPFGRGGGTTTLNRYTLGPTVEITLPFRLAFEADLLYKRLHSAGAARLGPYPVFYATQQANSWELPLLAKLRLSRGPVSPYVVAGPSLHWIRAHTTTRTTILAGTSEATTSATTSEGFHQTGVSAGGGIRLKLGILRLSPEVRYTHWPAKERDLNPFPIEHQAEFLLGITF